MEDYNRNIRSALLFVTELACNTWHQLFIKVNFLKQKIAMWFWYLLVLYKVIALKFSGSLQYVSTSDKQLLSLTSWRNSHGFNSSKALLYQPVQALCRSCDQESWPSVFKTAKCSVCGGNTITNPFNRRKRMLAYFSCTIILFTQPLICICIPGTTMHQLCL